MRWWSRAVSPVPVAPATVPVGLPRPDGGGWPDPAATSGRSFDASTFYEMGLRHAYDPEVHALADRLVTSALPRLATGAGPEDAPHLRKVFLSAARTGAGIGTVERAQVPAPSGEVDRRIAGALGLARRALPAMREDWALTGAWFVLAGRHLVLHEAALPELLDALDAR